MSVECPQAERLAREDFLRVFSLCQLSATGINGIIGIGTLVSLAWSPQLLQEGCCALRHLGLHCRSRGRLIQCGNFQRDPDDR